MAQPWFKMELRTNQELVNNLMALPVRARSNIRRKIQTELVPALEVMANNLAQDMPMPSSPFAFGTPKSRRYYFWMIRNDPGLSDGDHWIRTFLIESGWQFNAVDRIKEIQVTGRNANPEAKYVFGPWAVQGHINTGWPEKGEQIRAELQMYMRRELARMWRDSVREALKGQGLMPLSAGTVASSGEENSSIFNLLINADPAQAESILAQFNSFIEAGDGAAEAIAKINASAQAAAEGIEKVTVQVESLKAAVEAPATLPEEAYLKSLPQQVEAATVAVRGMREQLAGAAEQTTEVNALFAQMREGAYPFPASEQTSNVNQQIEAMRNARPQFEEPGLMEGEAGPNIGSQFALGHALTATGRTIGAPALTEAGAFVYIEEGLRKVGPLFEKLNTTIEASPGVLEPLVAGLTGLGVPMAGLLAVAVPVAVAVTGVVLALKNFTDGLQKGKDGLAAGETQLKAYYKAQVDGTTESIEVQKQKLIQEKLVEDQTRNANVAAYNSAQAQANSIPIFGGIVAAADRAFGASKGLSDAFEEGRKKSEALQSQIMGLTTAEQTAAVKANDAAEALLKQVSNSNDAKTALNVLAEAIKNGQVSAEKAAPVLEELWKKIDEAAIAGANQVEQDVMRHYQQQQIIEKGNVDQAKSNRAELQAEYDATSAAWVHLLQTGDQNSQAVQDQEKAYSEHAKFLLEQMAEYDNSVIPAAQHTKDMADAIKKIDDVAKESTKGWEKYFSAYQSIQDQLTNQRTNAITKEHEQEAVLTQGSLQDTQERTRISIEEGRKVTAIVNDTANAIVDIRTKMGQQDLAAQIDYNRKLMDDQTKYQEQQQTDWTNMYRKETDNLTAHQQKLADIQAKQANDQQDALLNRNFLQLAKQAQSKQTEIDAENTAYARKQAAEQLAYQRQIEDLTRHYNEQRTQDFVNYQRKLTDNQLHARQEIQQKEVEEQRKLQVARTWEQQALTDLTTNEQNKIAILRQGLTQELALYQQQAAARMAIAAREAAASSFPTGLPGMGGKPVSGVGAGLGFRDTGGPFAAAETFIKGDISEMFTFGGQSYSIPGAAIIHPLQGGMATPTPGGGGHQFNIPITINQKSGQDAALLASQEVYRRVKQMLGEV